jgi:hypothetical protein
MGGFANTQPQNQPTQVYYDPEKQQYFSYKQNTQPQKQGYQISQSPNPALSVFSSLFPSSEQERMYLNNPYTTSVANRIPQGTVSPYPSTDALFPALNAGLLGNLFQSSQPDGAMYGAGKYLTGTNLLSMPTTTTSESKGK